MSDSVAAESRKQTKESRRAASGGVAPRQASRSLDGPDENGQIAIGMLFFAMAVIGVIAVMILVAS